MEGAQFACPWDLAAGKTSAAEQDAGTTGENNEDAGAAWDAVAFRTDYMVGSSSNGWADPVFWVVDMKGFMADCAQAAPYTGARRLRAKTVHTFSAHDGGASAPEGRGGFVVQRSNPENPENPEASVPPKAPTASPTMSPTPESEYDDILKWWEILLIVVACCLVFLGLIYCIRLQRRPAGGKNPAGGGKFTESIDRGPKMRSSLLVPRTMRSARSQSLKYV